MNRPAMLARVNALTTPWDIVVIGGGATGVGVAVDAANRGFDVLLLSTGSITYDVLKAAELLAAGGSSAAVAVMAHIPFVFVSHPALTKGIVLKRTILSKRRTPGRFG